MSGARLAGWSSPASAHFCATYSSQLRWRAPRRLRGPGLEPRGDDPAREVEPFAPDRGLAAAALDRGVPPVAAPFAGAGHGDGADAGPRRSFALAQAGGDGAAVGGRNARAFALLGGGGGGRCDKARGDEREAEAGDGHRGDCDGADGAFKADVLGETPLPEGEGQG